MEVIHPSKTPVVTKATHGVTSQKTAFFIVTAMKTSNIHNIADVQNFEMSETLAPLKYPLF
jgi:hypothetical protein